MSTPNTQIGDKTPNKKFNMNNMVQSLGILPVLILLCVGFSILAPNFATESNLMNIVRQSSINMVLAAGMTFIIITGGIDLSVGSILGSTAVIAMVTSLDPAFSSFAVPAATDGRFADGCIERCDGRVCWPAAIHCHARFLYRTPRCCLFAGRWHHSDQQQY
jgi:Predicted ABC-type sugar transport system, permease component